MGSAACGEMPAESAGGSLLGARAPPARAATAGSSWAAGQHSALLLFPARWRLATAFGEESENCVCAGEEGWGLWGKEPPCQPSCDRRFRCQPFLTGAQGPAGAHPWAPSIPLRCRDMAVTPRHPELGLGGSAFLWLVRLEVGKVPRALLDPGAFLRHEAHSTPSSAV